MTEYKRNDISYTYSTESQLHSDEIIKEIGAEKGRTIANAAKDNGTPIYYISSQNKGREIIIILRADRLQQLLNFLFDTAFSVLDSTIVDNKNNIVFLIIRAAF